MAFPILDFPMPLRPPLHLTLLFLLALTRALAATEPAEAYLFTYFVKNGEDGLHLAWSEDGYQWSALGEGRSFLKPEIGTKEKLMRDPCVVRGPDGTYHMVWTSGWWERGIGYASTRDFITWTKPRELPVMAHEPKARNCWAPEVVWDRARQEFVIFWATTIPGRFIETEGTAESETNHRIYRTTTKDWETFTPTEVFFDPGFNTIDATIVFDGKYRMIVKDETKFPVRKHLRVATSDDAAGPWRRFAPPFTREWVEGPTALRVGNEWLVYFDVYREKHYGAMRTSDWVNWEDVTDRISIPAGARHGTMVKVPRELIEGLRSAPNPPAR